MVVLKCEGREREREREIVVLKCEGRERERERDGSFKV